MVIETWRKVYNGKIINIIVKHDDWWYQAFVNEKPITEADASLESLHNILYGNGCQRKNKVKDTRHRSLEKNISDILFI